MRAPQEERQARRELDVADRDEPRRPRRAGGILLDAEQELRRHEHRLDAPPGCRSRSRRSARPALVEREQRLDVGARHRTPERAVRERGENRSRAGRLLRRRSRGGRRKSSRRLGVSPRPVGVYGPPTISLVTSGVVAAHVESLQARAVQPQVDRRRDLRRAAPAAGPRRRPARRFRPSGSRAATSRRPCGARLSPATRTWYGSISASSPPAARPTNANLEDVLGVERESSARPSCRRASRTAGRRSTARCALPLFGSRFAS